MEEKSLIYVAGNPSAYPLEYFDSDTQTFEGVIPRLLREFSAQSTYEIVYYQPDGVDHREHLAAHKQVDLLSGYLPGDNPPENADAVTLFLANHSGTDYSYSLYFTNVSTSSFQSELQAYLSEVSQTKITGFLIEAAETPHNDLRLYWTIGALSVAILLLLATLLLLIRRYRKKLQQTQQNIETDAMTGLGNIEYLHRYYKQYVNDKNRILYQAIYFYVDTDHLRRISSRQETDEFLRYCALVLGEHTHDNDILARVSDHGFVMLKMTGGTNQTEAWLSTILDRMNEYAPLYSKTFDTNIYAGVYPLRTQDRDLNEIIFHVSQSAYAAEHENSSYLFCSQDVLEKFVQQRQLQTNLDQAFAKHEFQLYIQFYVDAQSFEVVGGEALARWNHPQNGILTPDIFLPLLEKEKMLDQLDYYCLKETCLFLEHLVKDGIDTFFLSCNCSHETFASADFAETVQKIVDEFTFPRELLILEITQSLSVSNIVQIQQNIISLKNYGIRIVLDDFGENFSDFYDLQKYPVDGFKLKKSLVNHIMSPSGASILNTLIQTGHELDMTAIAVGVETEAQVKALQEIHCDVIQGFQFFYPLPQREARKIINNTL